MDSWVNKIRTTKINKVFTIVRKNELYPIGALVRLSEKVLVEKVQKDRSRNPEGKGYTTYQYPFGTTRDQWYRRDDMPENLYLESDDIDIVKENEE